MMGFVIEPLINDLAQLRWHPGIERFDVLCVFVSPLGPITTAFVRLKNALGFDEEVGLPKVNVGHRLKTSAQTGVVDGAARALARY
jgi:hypothetical protein